MKPVLVLYASTHGHTAKIAERVAEALEHAGAAVDLRRVGAADEPVPVGYAAVVAGGSIHGGRHQRELAGWLRRHATYLNGMHTAFFSVSLTAADDTDEARATTRRYIDELVEETGWTPTRSASFAGALQYREYDLFTRLLVRLTLRRGGHPLPAGDDHDYTDWDAVWRFGGQVAAMLPAPVASP